jgi:guanylate kinase
VIDHRLANAQDEIRHCGEFDYVIINQDFATAVDDLAAIVRASRLRAAPQLARHGSLLDTLLAPPD